MKKSASTVLKLGYFLLLASFSVQDKKTVGLPKFLQNLHFLFLYVYLGFEFKTFEWMRFPAYNMVGNYTASTKKFQV